MKVFYSDEYVAAKHAFDTTRKAAEIAKSLKNHPITGVEVVKPDPVTLTAIFESGAHSEEYLMALKTGQPLELAQSQGFKWDTGLWDSVKYSTGGVIDAVEAALQDGVAGSLSSGLHHARFDRGNGFCSVNGLAVAALRLADLDKKVLIIDLDAHCGGGTASLIDGVENIWHTDISVSDFDSYSHPSNGTIDIVVPHEETYLDKINNRLEQLCYMIHSGAGFDVIIYNAGMDPVDGCGIRYETIKERERLVFNFASTLKIPIAWVLAGGYTFNQSMASLVGLHRLTIEAGLQALNRMTKQT